MSPALHRAGTKLFKLGVREPSRVARYLRQRRLEVGHDVGHETVIPLVGWHAHHPQFCLDALPSDRVIAPRDLLGVTHGIWRDGKLRVNALCVWQMGLCG